jgi:hypothetical protein
MDTKTHAIATRHGRRRCGIVAVIAMVFLVLFTTLAIAMFEMSSVNVLSAKGMSEGIRARAAAETGLRWMTYRFNHMNRPKTTVGNITATVANNLWPSIVNAINNDFSTLSNPADRTLTIAGNTITTNTIAVDEGTARFKLKLQQHPLFPGDPLDQRSIRVTSTATYGAATRIVSMEFKIDKKVKFAVIGKVEIQLGKNTMVEGPVAMGTPNKFPPFFALSDFKHLTPHLDTQITNFEAWLKANYSGLDGRLKVGSSTYNAAVAAGYSDTNGDGSIDEFDLFMSEFDTNHDGVVSKAEFTNPVGGQLYDPALFTAIDSLAGPLNPGDPIRVGYQDQIVATNDAYAKVRGQVLLADTAASWQSTLASSGLTLQDMFAGPIIPTQSGQPPVQFGVNPSQLFDLSPSNFDTSGFALKSGTNAGTTSKTATAITNAVLSATDANGGTIIEGTPYGSTSIQATYKRPVFKNMTFTNVTIPKGLNALFQNCTFKGTTFVQLTTNITNSSGVTSTSASDGMTWSKRMISGSFSNTLTLTAANSKGFTDGNNLRFDGCTLNGPIASDVPTAYTHFTNSWEFTGATTFDNQSDPTATVVAPQTNIEMGSFTDPAAAPSTMLGVVVAGNIDIRGNTLVDGSIVVTGDGAGNTTLGYFGASDGNTDPNAVPAEGWGKLNLRYNPYRPLPDGINISIDILPNSDSYFEG